MIYLIAIAYLILNTVLLTLKAVGIIAMSWFIVTLPLSIPILIFLCIFAYIGFCFIDSFKMYNK